MCRRSVTRSTSRNAEVSRAPATGSRAPLLGPTTTGSSRRTVHLPPHVVTPLADHRERFTGPDRMPCSSPTNAAGSHRPSYGSAPSAAPRISIGRLT